MFRCIRSTYRVKFPSYISLTANFTLKRSANASALEKKKIAFCKANLIHYSRNLGRAQLTFFRQVLYNNSVIICLKTDIEYFFYFMSRKKKETLKKESVNTGESFFADLDPKVKKTIIAVTLLTLALVVTLSLFGLGGRIGAGGTRAMALAMGAGRFFMPIGLFVLSLMYFGRLKGKAYPAIWIGIALMFLGFSGILHVFYDQEEMKLLANAGKGGGYLGYAVALLALKTVGIYAGVIVLVALVVIGALITFNSHLAKLFSRKDEDVQAKETPGLAVKTESFSLFKSIKLPKISLGRGNDKSADFSGKIQEEIEDKDKASNEEALLAEDGDEDEKNKKENENNHAPQEPKPVLSMLQDTIFRKKPQQMREPLDWNFPPTALLQKGSDRPHGGDIQNNSMVLEKTLADFGISAEVVDVNVGPTVTQYALRPADGVRLAKITSLQNDLSMALAAHSIRIEAPIPGKSLVGVEIPNERFAIVRLRNLLECSSFREREDSLLIGLGEDAGGDYVYADVAEMPHLLIAGATGAGKSIGINTIITALLYKHSPQDLKFILIDPKRVELSLYNGIPHLLTPVIVDIDKVVNSLKWVANQMDYRYRILQETQTRDIRSHNEVVRARVARAAMLAEKEEKERKVESAAVNQPVSMDAIRKPLAPPEVKEQEKPAAEPLTEFLPYIVVIIDELADIMITNGKEVETLIIRIAQKARAVGIHLILSTQRPSVEIITGIIKANIPTRIAYQVASQVDSRTILDMAGAEKLLGKGDMLYLSRDSGKPKRLQGAFITEEEVKRVVGFLKKQGEPDYDDEVTRIKVANGGNGIFDSGQFNEGSAEGGQGDALVDAARKVVIETQRASVTLLQRKLSVGYARAARLIEALEEEGVVGPYNGSKPRDILIKKGEDVDYEDNITDQEKRDKWSA